MRLTCPSCGAVASAEAWPTDQYARQVVFTLADLPLGMGARAMQYMALFRKPDSKTGLAWRKVDRLSQDLATLVTARNIQWDGGRIYDNQPEHWSQALDVVLNKPDLRRPLKDHNLLRVIAYGHAEKAFNDGHKAKEARAAGRKVEAQQRAPQPKAYAGQPEQGGDPAQSAARCRDFLDGLKKRGEVKS